MNNLKQTLFEKGIIVKQHENLADHTTMRAIAYANFYAEANSIEDLKKIFETLKEFPETKWMVLGGGSNTIFAKDFDGLIIHMNIMGKEVLEETDDHVLIRVGAGGDWHEFVTYAVENHWQGLENMAYIPGTVGAAPVQNVAAYGGNMEDVFESLEALNVETLEVETMKEDRLEFGYRSSAFKTTLKGKYVITSVTFKLNIGQYELETSYHERKNRYGSLEDSLKEVAKEPYDIKDVYNAVINIRKQKLPDPRDIGTVGSFFVNPVVTEEKYQELAQKLPELQSYPVEDLSYKIKDWDNIKDDYVKIPAGRLLDDELGWRGKWEGNVGVFQNHALCVVTNFKATGKEIKDFTEKMKQSVLDAYGIELESEVNIIE